MPSPKLQVKLTGAVPPVAEAVNRTCCPDWGVAGLAMKLTARVGGGVGIGLPATTKAWVAVAVCLNTNIPLSVVVRVTLNVPALVKV